MATGAAYHDEVKVVLEWQPKESEFEVGVQESLIGIVGLMIIRIGNLGDHVVESFHGRPENNNTRVETRIHKDVPPDIRCRCKIYFSSS